MNTELVIAINCDVAGLSILLIALMPAYLKSVAVLFLLISNALAISIPTISVLCGSGFHLNILA